MARVVRRLRAPTALLLGLGGVVVASSGGCSRARQDATAGARTARASASAPHAGSASPQDAGRGQPTAGFQLDWDPVTGKGILTQGYDNGDLARLCLQCKFPGYTGGLVIGNYSGSGFEYVPARPVRGFRSLNIFCAQDESIWDRVTNEEYSYGWSENFGTGTDGERLEYMSGTVDAAGPEAIVLRARNRGGCYEVDKRLLWRREARYVLVGTRIRNQCDASVHFDFWTGDDPWIGRYRSSEGDVGYVNDALVRTESSIDARTFRYGGVYDLGNSAAGEREGEYTGVANFLMPQPDLRRPDRIFIANRFAHADDEIRPGKPLDNKSMLAFNLGWTGVVLGPDEALTLGYALGMAITTGRPEPPAAPAITPAEWGQLDAWDGPLGKVRFESERVELDLSDTDLDVTGRYWLANDGAHAVQLGIKYPFPVDASHPAPELVELDGKPLAVEREAAYFSVKIAAGQRTELTVHYRQRHLDHSASYIVTSAARWKEPIRHAEFVIRYPRGWRDVKVSYPATAVEPVGDRIEHRFVIEQFRPTKEVTVRWK